MNRQGLTVRMICGLVLCGLMTGCSDKTSPTGPTGGPTGPSAPQVVDRTFTLAIDQGASVKDAGNNELQLIFRRVVSDDRCPGDAICVAGLVTAAVLEFDVVQSQTTPIGAAQGTLSMSSKTHISTDGPNSEVTLGAYTVRIEQLAPYRFASLPPIKAEDWRVTVRIKSATN